MLYAISLALVIPALLALVRLRGMSAQAFTFNNSETGLMATVCSTVCSNVGAGTFVAILLFSRVSPVIGMALVVCYTVGLLLCAHLASKIHATAKENDAYTLVDLIAARSGGKGAQLWGVWVPVAFVFVLRSAVQLTALSFLIAEIFGLSFTLSLIFATAVVSTYSLIGGYKAATETDILQASIVLLLMGVVAFGLVDRPLNMTGFFDLGSYEPTLLVGIVLLIPLSPVLAIDNWQRMATAKSPATARKGFMIAAVLCCAVYTTIWLVGMDGRSLGADPISTFRGLMPATFPWLADLLFITTIISSIDTFVMPLVTTFARGQASITFLRIVTGIIFVSVAVIAWLTGDLLDGIIAAFSSLIVFLPAVFGALYLKSSPPAAAWISMNGGLIVSLVVVTIDKNIAAIVGFLVSATIYFSFVYLAKRRSKDVPRSVTPKITA